MTTRIKYERVSDSLRTKLLTNYLGQKMYVEVFKRDGEYRCYILEENGDVVETFQHKGLDVVKRKARDLLLNKYNVRLNLEVRS